MTLITVQKDLRSELGAARNQGSRPTCLAFAVSDAHAALRAGWSPLSCEFAFYHAQRRGGRSPDSGATVPDMLAALRYDGQPEETGWPYLAATPTDVTAWQPPASPGSLFRRAGAAQPCTVNALLGELDQGRPVILLLTLSRSFYAPTADAVVRPAPGEAPEVARRHAVLAVAHGSVDGECAILVRNSWGPGWGAAGHAWLTETFIAPRLFGAALLTEDVDVPARSVAA